MMDSAMPFFSLTCLIFLTLLLSKAALHKLFNFAEFKGFVADYALMPRPWVPLAATAILGSELGAVLMLVLPPWRTVGLGVIIGLLGIYATAMGINLWRGRNQLECGCGSLPQSLRASLIVRNGVLATLAVLPLQGGLPQALSSQDMPIVLGGGLFLFVMYLLWEQADTNRVAIQKLSS
jgi:hypothetical protein